MHVKKNLMFVRCPCNHGRFYLIMDGYHKITMLRRSLATAGHEWSYSGVLMMTPSAAAILSAITCCFLSTLELVFVTNIGMSLISTSLIPPVLKMFLNVL